MGTLVELENGHAVLEVMTGDEPGCLELRENAVDRGETDILIGIEQGTVDVFG
jgi:hypothetical protein